MALFKRLRNASTSDSANNKLPRLKPNVLQPINATSTPTPSRQGNVLRSLQQSSSSGSAPSNGASSPGSSDAPTENTKASRRLRQAWQLLIFQSALFFFIQLLRVTAVVPWAILTYRAGFVGASLWPRLGLESIGIAIPLICNAGLLTRLPRIPPTSRTRYKDYFGAAALVVAAMILSGGLYRSFSRSVPMNITRQLGLQPEAVTRFNQGLCQAWCRQNPTESSFAAFVRGECGPNETTAFDFFVSFFNINDWCEQALASQNYSLGANYSGVSPFARWNGIGVDVKKDPEVVSFGGFMIFALAGTLIQMLLCDEVMQYINTSSPGNQLN